MNKAQINQLVIKGVKKNVEEFSASNPTDVFNFIVNKFEAIDVYEEFFALYVNNANKIIGFAQIGKGGVTQVCVDIKIILMYAVSCLATNIILVHNHPSEKLTPSTRDDALTKDIKDVCKFLDIRVLDHIIVSKNSYYSYNNDGRII